MILPQEVPFPMNERPVIMKPNPLTGVSARRIWSLLRPMDAVGGRLVRKGRDYDGGYVMLDHQLRDRPVYSFGINDDVSWDLDMVALGCTIYQYDHTIEALPAEHPRMLWNKLGICGRQRSEPNLRTLSHFIQENGHGGNTDLILKMDVEGEEWAVLETVSEQVLAQFSQIVLEIHWLEYLDQTFHFRRFVDGLSKLNRTHQVVHVHANNSGDVVFAGGVLLPNTFELTYVRRADHMFSTCSKLFPTELDMPCNHDAPDIFLGAVGLL